MTKTTTIDYVNTSFEYPVLIKIHKQPDYQSLKTIKDELKANATTVPTELGGGAYGHLGLVLTPEEYNNVAELTPYVRPEHPGPLVIPTGTTQHEATRRREDHKENNGRS